MAAKELLDMGVLYNERRRFNLNRRDDIHYLYPGVTPFLGWLTGLSEEKVDDPDFKMFQDGGTWRYERCTVNAESPSAWSDSGAPGATVAVAVDGAEGIEIDQSLIGVTFEIWDATKTTSKGQAFVNSVSGANVTLKALGNPQVGNQAMSALADNDILEVITQYSGEGSTSPEPISDELSVVMNSCGITRTPVEVTGTLYETFLDGSDQARAKARNELVRLRKVAMKRHKLRLEKKLLMSWRINGIGGVAHGAGGGTDAIGNAHTTNASSQKMRTTAGYIPALLRYGRTSGDFQNVFTFSKGSVRQLDLDAMMDKLMQYVDGGGMRTAFAGPEAHVFFTGPQLGKNSKYDFEVSDLKEDKKLGFAFNYIETGKGVLKLASLSSLRQTGYSNTVLLPNEDAVERKYHRPDRYNTNIKTDNGYDGVKDEYMSDDGLCLTQIDGHGLIRLV